MRNALMRDIPSALYPQKVQNINRDLFHLVTKSGRTDFEGKSMDYIFSERHGIISHGFSFEGTYRIHAKSETCVLVERII